MDLNHCFLFPFPLPFGSWLKSKGSLLFIYFDTSTYHSAYISILSDLSLIYLFIFADYFREAEERRRKELEESHRLQEWYEQQRERQQQHEELEKERKQKEVSRSKIYFSVELVHTDICGFLDINSLISV